MIQKGLEKQLVYYWFEGKGRRQTSAFAVKFATILDGITTGRSDGGLVRVITPIDGAGEAAADARLRDFLTVGIDRLSTSSPNKQGYPPAHDRSDSLFRRAAALDHHRQL